MEAKIVDVTFMVDMRELKDWAETGGTDMFWFQDQDGYTQESLELDGFEIVAREITERNIVHDGDDVFHRWMENEIDNDMPSELQYNLCGMRRNITPLDLDDDMRRIYLDSEVGDGPEQAPYHYLIHYVRSERDRHNHETRQQQNAAHYKEGYRNGLKVIWEMMDGAEWNADLWDAIAHKLTAIEGFAPFRDPNVEVTDPELDDTGRHERKDKPPTVVIDRATQP